MYTSASVLGLGILTGRTGENTLARGRRRTDARRSEETGRAVWRIERLYLENETPMYIGEVDKN